MTQLKKEENLQKLQIDDDDDNNNNPTIKIKVKPSTKFDSFKKGIKPLSLAHKRLGKHIDPERPSTNKALGKKFDFKDNDLSKPMDIPSNKKSPLIHIKNQNICDSPVEEGDIIGMRKTLQDVTEINERNMKLSDLPAKGLTRKRTSSAIARSVPKYRDSFIGKVKHAYDHHEMVDNNKVILDIATSSVEGLYHENEDRLTSILNLNDTIECNSRYDNSFWGVYDGHGGPEAADYVKENLHYEIGFAETFEDDLEQAVRDGIMSTEKKFCKWSRSNQATSGACIISAILRGRKMVIGHSGDCRAVFYDGDLNEITTITKDHTSRNPDEKKRIEDAGGYIKGGRVLGVLEPSRSIGDVDVKTQEYKDVVVATPDICSFTIHNGKEEESKKILEEPDLIRKQSVKCSTPKTSFGKKKKSSFFSFRQKRLDNRAFLILGSDGIWDGIKTESAVRTVKKYLKKRKPNLQGACDELVKKAQKRTHDDITCVIVAFRFHEDSKITRDESKRGNKQRKTSDSKKSNGGKSNKSQSD